MSNISDVLGIYERNPSFRTRGFLPEQDPLIEFPDDSPHKILDEIGRDLPSMLEDTRFRKYAQGLEIPRYQKKFVPINKRLTEENYRQVLNLPELRLYYVHIGFLASAYVNHVGEPPVDTLPENIADPLVDICDLLERPPILSYDGYALYNWKRFRRDGPLALGNIDTIQNFVHRYDEHWFILVHVKIEAIAMNILNAICYAAEAQWKSWEDKEIAVNLVLHVIGESLWDMVRVLRRIPEKMDPALYYKTFRPYIQGYSVKYETRVDGRESRKINFRGETGAQSSIIPTLVAFLKIPHAPSRLTNHLADMRNYMPLEHRALIEAVERMPEIRPIAEKQIFNEVLDAIAEFRSVHFGWAQDYINRRTKDPLGTGGTPYMEWLKQLIVETIAFKIQ